jgi:hypothetical protein
MSATPAPPIRRLAWRVFAPLDAAINVVINGGIAWWLYGGRDEIPLTGPSGLTMMALPMTFILATATTYFGMWNAVRERRAGRAEPALGADASWVSRACTEAVATGAVAWLLAVGMAWVLGRFNPDARVGPVGAVSGIAASAGVIAFLLHGRAVTRGGLLRSGRDSSAGIERSA